jgi:hypothetical protein
MKKETKINYRMPGKYVLLFSPTTTKGGIQLLAGSRTTEDFTVAAVGKAIEDTNIGDRIVFDGGASLWKIDGIDYWQIHESQIVGYILDKGEITKGTLPDHSAPDATAHYNQNR